MQRPALFQRSRRAAAVFAAAALWSACSDTPSSVSAPELVTPQAAFTTLQERDLRVALAAQARNDDRLMAIPGVVGHAVGVGAAGEPAVVVFTIQPGIRGIPDRLDDVPTRTVVSGMVMALTDETAKHRPAPLGVSLGHPDITAGTLGFKVKDAAGNSYILSNNHVLANSNDADIGDNILQPGPFDGGTDPADKIATLSGFVPIDFSGGDNVVDAAIASVDPLDVIASTPLDEGYGLPSATTVQPTLGMAVQKYGRTTGATQGIVDAINGTFNICYEPLGQYLCLKSARFVGQIVITPGTFSAGGDSGSGIVTVGGDLNPVALLFAGSTAYTIANPIGAVLGSFDVSIDDGGSEPPPDLTDIRIASVSAPESVAGGEVVSVTVTVSNSGNQDVGASFTVQLEDVTDGGSIGSQLVPGLSAGASVDVVFSWDTNGASFGAHDLVATHDFSDDQPGNDQGSRTVMVVDPTAPAGIHVGDLDAIASDDGSSWSVTVEVAVHGPSHEPLNGVTVVGQWSSGVFGSDTCTTGELGGLGTCIFLGLSIPETQPSATFTVTSVTATGETYDPAQNHDADGDSDGTSITAQNPSDANSPPVAGPDAYQATVGVPLSVPAPGVLGNDTDGDGDGLTAVLGTPPSAVAGFDLGADGSFTYSPTVAGNDSFTYRASDGELTSDAVTVSITVLPAGLTVTAMEPAAAAPNSVLDVLISGSGFVAGATAAFENGSGPAPTFSSVVVVDQGTIMATVTVKGGGPPRARAWDVRVTNPDGTSAILSGGFVVTP